MKYSPEKTEEICEHLRTGMTRVDTCILSDIHYDTFTEWMKKPEFSEAIKKAEISNKQRSAVIIQQAAKKSWQAAAWWLERKYKDEYATRNELTGKEGGKIEGMVVYTPAKYPTEGYNEHKVDTEPGTSRRSPKKN